MKKTVKLLLVNSNSWDLLTFDDQSQFKNKNWDKFKKGDCLSAYSTWYEFVREVDNVIILKASL